jgi:quinoprotein glucose dehydrogenase
MGVSPPEPGPRPPEVHPAMPRSRYLCASALAVLFSAPPIAQAQDESYKPEVAKATEEPQKALKSLRVAPGFKVELFAAEPLLANPVAFHIDEKGKFYVIETFRHSDGVTDTRSHMNWLDDDLKSRTVADRVAMYRKYFKPDEFAKYAKQQDRIKLIEDTDGDGKADKATVFADGFNLPETGIGAGVLARKGNVYFACIPDLWLLKDTDGDGKADVRTNLSTGYGVHVGFLGHDLHGLIMGPDGKLYFSIGDRGFNVKTIDGKTLAVIDSGSVLRCDPDGKNLEVVATGLRNPQELAFTETGDLFTVDNNSDGGDKARLVQILEGGDSGWRIGYQFIERPNSRGIWNSEKMWHPAWDGQAAYIVPPLANFTDGPSGFAYYPGTGLNATQKGRFYISDFRGAANTSGIRSFKLQPKGASFELTQPEQFLWGFEVTDCDFGPDGALYATDWVQGWNKTGKGRIWKVTDPNAAKDLAIADTKSRLAEDFDGLRPDQLTKFFAHPDQRVRLKAQFALADKAIKAHEAYAKAVDLTVGNPLEKDARGTTNALMRLAIEGKETLPRLHALWGLEQVFRSLENPPIRQWMQSVLTLLKDPDAEVRCQSALILSRLRACNAAELTPLVRDANARVRMFGLMAMGRIGDRGAIPEIVARLKTEDARDPTLRHACVMALSGVLLRSPEGEAAIKALAADESAGVRMGVLLALRSVGDAGASWFLEDPEPTIALESARAIVENPGQASQVALVAVVAPKPALASAPFARRVVAACEATGDARGLVLIASRSDVPEAVRVEALGLLSKWAKPSHRHPITGLYRDIADRPAAPAVAALSPVLLKLLASPSDRVRNATAKAAGDLGIKDAGPTLRGLAADVSRPADSRVEAMKALDALKDEKLDEVAHAAMKDASPAVRVEAVRIIAKTNPDEAIDAIHGILDNGPAAEKQGAFATLGEMKNPKADTILKTWLNKLSSGGVAPEIRLDLTEAAAKRDTYDLKAKLAAYESSFDKGDPLAKYRDALAGGDAERGRRVFREKAEVQCLRCHKVNGDGGEVGPELAGIGAKKDRAYILESIVTPNKQIAQGFETTLLAKKDGQIVTGIVKADDVKEVRLITFEGKIVTVAKDDIDEKTRGTSAMPDDTIKNLSKTELRDLVEFLATTKAAAGSR